MQQMLSPMPVPEAQDAQPALDARSATSMGMDA